MPPEGSNARSKEQGAGRSSNDPAASQLAESSRRETADEQQGRLTADQIDQQKENSQRERENAGSGK